MKEVKEKRVWETPKIFDLDIEETEAKNAHSFETTAFSLLGPS